MQSALFFLIIFLIFTISACYWNTYFNFSNAVVFFDHSKYHFFSDYLYRVIPTTLHRSEFPTEQRGLETEGKQ